MNVCGPLGKFEHVVMPAFITYFIYENFPDPEGVVFGRRMIQTRNLLIDFGLDGLGLGEDDWILLLSVLDELHPALVIK